MFELAGRGNLNNTMQYNNACLPACLQVNLDSWLPGLVSFLGMWIAIACFFSWETVFCSRLPSSKEHMCIYHICRPTTQSDSGYVQIQNISQTTIKKERAKQEIANTVTKQKKIWTPPCLSTISAEEPALQNLSKISISLDKDVPNVCWTQIKQASRKKPGKV